MTRWGPILITASLALAPGCGSDRPSGATDSGSDGTSRLPEGMYAFAGLDPSLPDDDLAPIDSSLERAQVIGLGESAHFSEGFFQARIRLLEYMIERKGVRVILLETPWGPAMAADAFATRGEGSSLATLQDLFVVWQSKSMQRLLEWLRYHNARYPEAPVRFFGFENFQPWYDARQLQQYLMRVRPSDSASLMTGISRCEGVANPAASAADYYASQDFQNWVAGVPIADADNDACTSGLAVLGAYLDGLDGHVDDAITLAYAKLSHGSLATNQEMVYQSGRDALALANARERGSYRTFGALRTLEFPGQRAALWAHNAHIAKKASRYDQATGTNAVAFGELVTGELADRYVNIGMTAYSMAINPWGQGAVEVPVPTADDSLDRILHRLGRPYLLLDLPRALPAGVRYQVTLEHYVPAEQFDWLLYLERSEPIDFWWL
jgi:erythromycin esterase-like protein